MSGLNLVWKSAGAGRHGGPKVSVSSKDADGVEFLVCYAHFDYVAGNWIQEKVVIESENDVYDRIQRIRASGTDVSLAKVDRMLAERAAAAARMDSLTPEDMRAVKAFVSSLPEEANQFVVESRPERPPVPVPNPLEPIAFTLPDVAPIDSRDTGARELIRVLTQRVEDLCGELNTLRESCDREHANLTAANKANKAILNSHLTSPYHMYTGGSGFSKPTNDNEI
jgi:hypothetical protein